jgi:hypothetical protein
MGLGLLIEDLLRVSLASSSSLVDNRKSEATNSSIAHAGERAAMNVNG